MSNSNNRLAHKFVEFIPSDLAENTLYISIKYATATHKCCCGCGLEVVTPFSPTDWKLIFDGETVSLNPSIGNWSFPCKSHYWIKRNYIVWAETWGNERIQNNRVSDRKLKLKSLSNEHNNPNTNIATAFSKQTTRGSFWLKLKSIFRRH